MMCSMAGPGNAPQLTNDDRDEEDQIACAGFAWHGQGRGQDSRCHRCRRSLSISAGRLAREVPPPGSGRLSYFRQPPSLNAERYPDPRVPLPLEPSALPHRDSARPIRRHSSPAERSPSQAPDGGWICRWTDRRRQRSSSEGQGRTRSGSCGDDAHGRGCGRPDACLRGSTNGGPYSRSIRLPTRLLRGTRVMHG